MAVSFRGRYLGLVLLAVTFTVGALVGAATHRVLEARPAATAPARAGAGCAEADRDIFASLELTGEQRGRVDQILARRREQAEHFWQDAGPRLQALMDSTRSEIRAVLTEEQREQYDRLREERRARKKNRSEIH